MVAYPRTIIQKQKNIGIIHNREFEEGVLKVFIRANGDFKRGRAVSEYGVAEKNAEATCRRFDKKRSTYYTFNTSKKWNDATNYDMVLDSSTLGIDGCVKVIAALLEQP